VRLLALAAAFALWSGAARPSLAAGPDPRDEVRVHLEFGEEADLDLLVSDPLLETVYYGNTPSRSGGRLLRDLRCDAPAPRRETVVFPGALPGRYRVSVDYPARCRRELGAVPYRVVVEAEGRRLEHAGVIELGRFETLALEFEVGRPPTP
jgi:hypothetical protein